MPRRLRIRQLSQLTDTGGAVVVAAPSRWTIPPQVHRRTGVTFDTVLVWFREWLTDSTHPNAIAMRAALPQLRGRDLACWCALDAPCHADVLLELANAPATRATGRKPATLDAEDHFFPVVRRHDVHRRA